MVGCVVCAIKHEGWGQETNTARGEAECCIGLETPPRVLYCTYSATYRALTNLLCVWVAADTWPL